MHRRSPFAVFFAIAAACSLASAASAQGKTETVIDEPDRVVYKAVTTMKFTEVFLDGELQRPAGEYAVSKKKIRFRNMIQMRAHFRKEMRRGANAL